MRDINLINSLAAEEQSRQDWFKILIALPLVVVLIAVGSFYGFLKYGQAQMKNQQSEATEYLKKLSEVNQVKQSLDYAKTRHQIFVNIENKMDLDSFDPVFVMDEVAQLMPADVYFSQITIIDGGACNITGFAKSKEDIAFLMSRMMSSPLILMADVTNIASTAEDSGEEEYTFAMNFVIVGKEVLLNE